MNRPSSRFFLIVDRLVDLSRLHPLAALLIALALSGGLWGYASRLELRSVLRELLPRNSAEYQAYERQSSRSPQGANLLVMASSPQREDNLKYISLLAEELRRLQRDPFMGIRVVDADNLQAHEFFSRTKWLYAPQQTLLDADAEIGRTIAIQSGLVEDLSERTTRSCLGQR